MSVCDKGAERGGGGLVITYFAIPTEHKRNRGKGSTQESHREQEEGRLVKGRESRGRYLAGRIRNLHIVRFRGRSFNC